ncbi:MAG: type II toxin-antitoxin system RelE/ParE family toxin [Nitrococcus sp.]|nr:type II toxin-antitoxin system RelE/ParE family toxin [Nitrococcus sp.]
MSATKRRVILSSAAEDDFTDILERTARRFGTVQARIYRDTLKAAIRAIGENPTVAGSKGREELGPGLRTLHVARGGRRGRHVILYRERDDAVVDVLRILFDTMDFIRHAPMNEEN